MVQLIWQEGQVSKLNNLYGKRDRLVSGITYMQGKILDSSMSCVAENTSTFFFQPSQ